MQLLSHFLQSSLYFFLPRSSRKNAHSSLRYFGIRGIASTSFLCCLFADMFPKRRNARNRIPLYVFGAISGVCFRYERLSKRWRYPYRRLLITAVCRFRVTKKRRISTTLLSCSEDRARERYSIICCTFSFCRKRLLRLLHRRWRTTGRSTKQGCLYRQSADSYRMFPVWYWQVFSQE